MRLAEFEAEKRWWTNRQESEQSWKVSANDIAENNYNLDIKNPNTPIEIHDDPELLLAKYSSVSNEVKHLQMLLKETLKKSMDR
jgi:type I restriction enzyme M protein